MRFASITILPERYAWKSLFPFEMLSRVNIRLDYETVRFLSALEALRHLRCQQYFRQRGAHIWRIMHHRVHNWLHLQLARAALIPDVYRVYGADCRDRNVDCLDNAGENAYSRLAIIRTFSREILGVRTSAACMWATTSAACMLSSSLPTCTSFAWNLTPYVREQHPTAFMVNYGNVICQVPRPRIKWKPYHYSFYSSAHLWMLTAVCSYVLVGWSRIPRAVGKRYRINRRQATWETLREGTCLPAFLWIILPNCCAILINRKRRQIVAVLDERSLRIAINA